MDTEKLNSNPFIGPAAFTSKDKLHGRDREAEKLLNILIACRIVVLFSCSGAGKTSLIQAKLCPMLEQENFHVWPVVRVGNEIKKEGNRYIQSMLQGLENKGVDEQISVESQTACMKLSLFFSKKSVDNKDSLKDSVLIIDQFEEIFTRDTTDFSAKEEFFADLSEALSENRNLWVLFAMREEYIVELNRYDHLMPTNFKNMFRLELLEPPAAALAIRGPIKGKITEKAINKLINELRKIRFYDPYSGTSTQRTGPYIEPLLLQLSCHRLWEENKRKKEISEDDIASSEYIDQTFIEYYEKKVKETRQATQVDEDEIRAWCEQNLITHNHTRNMVMRGTHSTSGMMNRVVDHLEDCHLIRRHHQPGQIWYELIHDRFIEPIIKSNTKSKFKPRGNIKSETDLNQWLEVMAYHLSSDRRWLKIKAMSNQALLRLTESRQEECDNDFKCAGILFGCHILDNILNFAHYNEKSIYSHLQKIWLSEIKELKAFYKSTGPDAGQDMRTNYYTACHEIRQQLVKTAIKASREDFENVKTYLTDHYLNEGKLDLQKKQTQDLIKKKHDKINNKYCYPREKGCQFAAGTYVELFYENIIPAAMEQEPGSILMVLKAFHFSEADEHQYHIISGFEAALAIYFLNPDTIVSLWGKSNGEKIQPFSVTVPVSDWPVDFIIPNQCKDQFLITASGIKFKGVMNEEQKTALKENADEEDHKKMIDALFEESRLLPREKTL